MLKQTQNLLAGYKLNYSGEMVWSVHRKVHKNYKLAPNSTKYLKNRYHKGTGSTGIGRVDPTSGEYVFINSRVRTYPKPEDYDATLKPLVDPNVNRIFEKWDLTKYPKGHLSGSYITNLVLENVEDPDKDNTIKLTTVEEGVNKGRNIIEKK